MCLDLATQEWLNVGVQLEVDGGSRHWRLIDNLSGLQCLYNVDAVDSARFLLDQVEAAFEEKMLIPPGWNISYGPEKFIRGETAEGIVQSLFTRLVPLSNHQTGAERIDREDHLHATANVRRTVRKLLNKHLQLSKNGYPDFWHKSPVLVERDSSSIQMDVQIRSLSPQLSLHGSIASAWYKTKYHRSASLSQAVNAMTTACEAFPDSNNVLYLLKPPQNIATLSAEDHKEIEGDIESSRWLLTKHGASLKTLSAETEMAHMILCDLQLIS